MRYKDISIRKKILLSNFLMILIPILCIASILFFILLTFSFFTNSSSLTIRNVLLNSSNYGPTLLIRSMTDELAMSDTLSEEALSIFDRLEDIGVHLYIQKNETLYYISDGCTPVSLKEEISDIGAKSDDVVPYIIWNQKGMAYESTFENHSGDTITLSFSAIGLPLPEDSYASWEHTKMIIKIVILVAGTLIIFLIAFLGLVLTKKLSKHILQPLLELQIATNEIQSGNLACSLKSDSQDELGELCRNFESMRKQLITSEQQKRRYEQNRKDLIAGISHDLNTPLTSIQGYVNGLLDGIATTPEKQQHYLKIIQEESAKMTKLVDSLLLFSKLDVNQEPFHEVHLNLHEYMEEWLRDARDIYDRKMEILYENDAKDVMVYIDPYHFQRVLNNIAQNSYKYRKDDDVHLWIHLYKDTQVCHITLQDDGCGIREEEAARLFDSFYRSDPARSSRIKGNGLGLAITKQIIDYSHGTISASGAPMKGLCIHITLPMEVESHEKDTDH